MPLRSQHPRDRCRSPWQPGAVCVGLPRWNAALASSWAIVSPFERTCSSHLSSVILRMPSSEYPSAFQGTRFRVGCPRLYLHTTTGIEASHGTTRSGLSPSRCGRNISKRCCAISGDDGGIAESASTRTSVPHRVSTGVGQILANDTKTVTQRPATDLSCCWPQP
jgi:hypothetical protein